MNTLIGIVVILVLLGLLGLGAFVMINDQRRQNEQRRAMRKFLRENQEGKDQDT